MSGPVTLVAKAAPVRASYEWEWSSDGDEKWIELPKADEAKTTRAGICRGMVAQFLSRSVTKNGMGDSAHAVASLV
jgi:hypothetical protein